MAADPVVPTPSLHLEIKVSGDTVTVLCYGRVVNDNTLILQNDVRQLIHRPEFNNVLLDLSDVQYVDSAGIGALVGLFVTSKRLGKTLRLIHMKDRVKELLRIANLLSILEG